MEMLLLFTLLPAAALAGSDFDLSASQWAFNILDADADGLLTSSDTREALASAHPRVLQTLLSPLHEFEHDGEYENDEYESDYGSWGSQASPSPSPVAPSSPPSPSPSPSYGSWGDYAIPSSSPSPSPSPSEEEEMSPSPSPVASSSPPSPSPSPSYGSWGDYAIPSSSPSPSPSPSEEEEIAETVQAPITVTGWLTFPVRVDSADCTHGGSVLAGIAAAERRAISQSTGIALQHITTDDIQCEDEAHSRRLGSRRSLWHSSPVRHEFTVSIPEGTVVTEGAGYGTAAGVTGLLDALVEAEGSREAFVDELLSTDNLGAVDGVTIDLTTRADIESNIAGASQEANVPQSTDNASSSSAGLSNLPGWAFALVGLAVVLLVVGGVAMYAKGTAEQEAARPQGAAGGFAKESSTDTWSIKLEGPATSDEPAYVIPSPYVLPSGGSERIHVL